MQIAHKWGVVEVHEWNWDPNLQPPTPNPQALVPSPVSQDQTTTVLFFQRRCVVLKFQDHTTTGHCPGGCFSIVLISLSVVSVTFY